MAKARRRAKAQCPKCGFNLEGILEGRAGNKGFRIAGKDEAVGMTCPSCKTRIVPLE